MLDRVFFEKPRLKELKEAGFLAVDMHFHTEYSDSTTKVVNLIKLAKKRQVGVSITDHNTVTGSLKAMETSDMFVIPGIEVNCREGRDMQVYFYNKSEMIEFYEKGIKNFRFENPFGRIKKTVMETLNDLENYNCIATMSQPYGIAWKGWIKFLERNPDGEKIIEMIDAIEVMNGEDTRIRNLKSIYFAMEAGKPITAGSDGHTLGELGRVVSYAKADDVDSFLDAVRKGKNYVAGIEGTRLRGIFNQSRVFHKRLRYMPSTAKRNYQFSVKNRIDEITPRVKKQIKDKINKLKEITKNRFGRRKKK